MTDNMKLWNEVCKTNPGSTTHVAVRGGFTAICAMSQIQAATEQFGAAGNGWGWSFTDPLYPPNGTVVVKCVLWHGKKENTVEQFGQKNLGKDEDALKKAGTDALTKCLSYLGFNADVFLGKFDDNKYVAELAEQEAKKKQAEEKRKKAETWVNNYMLKLDALDLSESTHDLVNLQTDNVKWLKAIESGYTALHKVITTKTNEIRNIT